MKHLSGMQKFWAVLGAGLLVAAASGSALAMRAAEDHDMRRIEIQQEKKLTTSTSPLPTPAAQPTLEPENEVGFTGSVEVMASDMWVVGGRTVAITAATEIKSDPGIGMLVKVHAVRQADGSLWAREIEVVGNDDQGNSNSNDNGNEDNDNHNGNVNSNDDNGNDDHGNMNSNDDNGNDDHVNVNSNDNGNVNANDNNGNDDHGSNGNSNNDNGNDDHGGNGNDDHGGKSKSG